MAGSRPGADRKDEGTFAEGAFPDDGSMLRQSRASVSLVLTLLVVLAGGYAAIALLDTGAMITRFREADRRLLAIAGLVAAMGWPLRGWRYCDILAGMRTQVGIGLLTLTVMMSQTANLVVPARAGDGVRAVLLADRAAVPVATGIASVLVERLFDAVGVLILAGVALLMLTILGAETGVWLVGGGILVLMVATVCVLVFCVLSRTEWHRAMANDWIPEAVRQWLSRMSRSIALVGRRPRLLGRLTLASVVVWTVDILGAGIVAIAVTGQGSVFASGIGIGAIAFAVAGGNLAKSVPLTQGGIGVYESAVTALLLVPLSLAPETALTIGILDHAIKNAVTILGGVGGAIWFHLRPIGNGNVPNR